jgi:hypothetical protein
MLPYSSIDLAQIALGIEDSNTMEAINTSVRAHMEPLADGVWIFLKEIYR